MKTIIYQISYILLFTIATSCGNSDNNQNNSKSNTKVEAEIETINVRLEDLEREYKENGAAFEARYKNKFIIFDCTIHSIEASEFHINAINSHTFFDYYICWMEDKSGLISLQKGQSIRLKCMVSAQGMNFYFCQIL
jgi:hypothetical protein